MSHISDLPLQWNFTCRNCRENNIVQLDAQQVVAESVIGYLERSFPGLISRHLRDVSQGFGRWRKDEVDRLKKEIAELNQRLTEQLADQTSGRMDVGTTMHTAHRQLSDQVSGLYSRIHRNSREWTRKQYAAQSDPRTLAIHAAILFQLLFAPETSAPHLITDRDREMWESFVVMSKEARALATDAASLAEQIKGLPGCQRWIWDIAPPGTIFNSSVHLPWQGCLDEGAVDFVVIPAYLVDLSVITRPQVFTSWA